MKQIYVNPIFKFANNWSGLNDCHLTVAVSDDMNRVLVVAAQRHNEWMRGTSAINQCEEIAQLTMLNVMPDLFREYPTLKRAEMMWVIEVVTGDGSIYNVRTLLDIRWRSTPSWFRRLFQPYDYTLRPQVDFFNGVKVTNYEELLQKGRSAVIAREPKAS